MPEALEGPEVWSGWRESDFGYPLVNYVRGNGGGLQCAYLTERELGEKPGVRADIARVRMVCARDRLRGSVPVNVTCGTCGVAYLVNGQFVAHTCTATPQPQAARPAGHV